MTADTDTSISNGNIYIEGVDNMDCLVWRHRIPRLIRLLECWNVVIARQ